METPKNTISKIQCSGCGKFFAGTSAHEQHRKGDYSTRASRGCMTEEEMHTAGLDCEKKNVRITVEGKATYKEHDVWFDVAGREHVKKQFRGTEE